MNLKTKNRLIQAARRISMGWAPRVAAKKKAKVDAALYTCACCKGLVYEGSSPVTYDYYLQVYGNNVVMENLYMDHIIPVVATNTTTQDWNVYYERLFCEESNYQALCHSCHTAKTRQENKERKLHKGKKK